MSNNTTFSAKLGALYINVKFVAPIWQMLHEKGHPQPPMPIQTNNLTAYGFIMQKIIPMATKAMDMHYHWLHDREQQQQFRFYWQPGKTNYVDY